MTRSRTCSGAVGLCVQPPHDLVEVLRGGNLQRDVVIEEAWSEQRIVQDPVTGETLVYGPFLVKEGTESP